MNKRHRRREKTQEPGSAPRFSKLLQASAGSAEEVTQPDTPPQHVKPRQRDGFDSIVRNGIAHIHPM